MASQNQISVTYNGETRVVDDVQGENGRPLWRIAADELIAAHGAGLGIPKVEPVNGTQGAPQAAETPVAAEQSAAQPEATHPAPLPPAPPVPQPSPSQPRGGEVDATGKLRSLIDASAAEHAGFAPAQPLYERGTRVEQIGVDAARRFRQEHDARPTTKEFCEAFVERIAAENRQDTKEIRATDLRMNREGLLALNGDRYQLGARAFSALVTKMGIGGTGYLRACWPELRAINFNHWTQYLAGKEREAFDQAVTVARENPKRKTPTLDPQRLVLRTRDNPNAKAREVFGIVTARYTEFDVDKIAKAIALAAPPEARGTATYDGRRAKFNVMFHSTVEPEDYVAGEFFRAGVLVQTDDAGGGSIVVRAFVEQNLCLNLIIIDTAKQDVTRLRHIGSVEQLAERFRSGFDAAVGKLEHFLKAWGYATEENVLVRAQAATSADVPMTIEEALPGLFNGIIERELVPVRGRRVETVPKLIQMWHEDESSQAGRPSRGGIVNAFTRYAHHVNQDPWHEDEIQAAAGALLFGRGGNNPEPLPYIPTEARTA